jgi:hypothetical protein
MFINCPQSNSTAEQPGRILSLCTACTLCLMPLFYQPFHRNRRGEFFHTKIH